MFTLKQDNNFTWPVRIEVPEDKKHVTHTVNMRFQALPQDRAVEIKDDGAATDDVFFTETVIGWDEDDVRDADGEPIAFSAEALGKLIAIPYVRLAIVRAYAEAIVGGSAARKNS